MNQLPLSLLWPRKPANRLLPLQSANQQLEEPDQGLNPPEADQRMILTIAPRQ